jgi:hypothetical protein
VNVHPSHSEPREIHYWSEDLTEPPCETLEDRFDWSDSIDDVTCLACREALAGDSGDLGSVEADELPGAGPHGI